MKTHVIIGALLTFAWLPLRAQNTAGTAADSKEASTNLDMTVVIKKSLPFTNSVGMAMVPVNDFWAGVYEVTQDAYKKVTGANPSRFQGTNNPVDSVSWNDAMAFCKKLTEIERKKSKLPDNYAYTLPTQAQWVTLTDSASLDTAVSSLSGMRNSTASVGSLGPNQLGLYDTRGNVWEFCLDRHDPSQAYRVLRGGAWDTTVKINMRIDFRFYATGPNDAKDDFGFRCVLIKTRSSASNQSGGPIVLH